MIKIDQNYTDYRDDSDPKYPGGKAVNATTSEGTDGTPLLADWMNDVNGALQAIFIEAFGNIDKVSGKPDNVQESDVLKAVKEIIRKLLPGLASQGDPSDANSTQGTGLVKTANRNPNEKECQQNEPWAASPNWVYNLLLGNAASEVNTAVTGALKERLGVDSLAGDTFRFRGDVTKANIDNVVIPGSYTVLSSTYSGALLVFATYGSTGIVQFYKDGYQDEPWMCRNAIDSDQKRWTDWSFIGVQLTVNLPSMDECQRNRPWAASPNWVYNLLLGKVAEAEVNTAVTAALKERLGVDSFENIAIKLFSHYTCAITVPENYSEKKAPPDIVGCRWVYVVRDGFKDIENKYAFLSFWRLEVL